LTSKRDSSEHYFTARPESEAKTRLIKTHLCGKLFEFMTASSVFSKRRVDTGTRLLIESMVLPEHGMVLDVGCGYGAVGIAAASFKPSLQVTLTDVNMRAVRLARENIERNKICNAEARWGYLYDPVEPLRFNAILSNPPVSAGMDVVKSIITEAPRVMTTKATLQMVVRSKIGAKALPVVFEDTFGNCRVLARESGYRVLTATKL
jgi:16S rRNA (guanine1207-N2)-methyltransferase